MAWLEILSLMGKRWPRAIPYWWLGASPQHPKMGTIYDHGLHSF